jgi:hypothetical protein
MWYVKYLVSAVIMLFTIAGTGAWWFFAGPGRYGEFNAVKERLSSIAGVEIINAGGNEDLTFEDIYATVEINGIILTFQQLTTDSFESPDSIIISRVGSYVPSVRGCARLQYSQMRKIADGSRTPERFYGTSIDIGLQGEFGSMLSPPYKNVQDVLARANELGEHLRSWPAEADERYLDGSQKIYTYWVQATRDGAYEGPWKDLLEDSQSEKGRADYFAALHDPQRERYCTSVIDGSSH